MTPKQYEALDILAGTPSGIPTPQLTVRGIAADAVSRLARHGLVSLRQVRVDRDPFHLAPISSPPVDADRRLTPEQTAAVGRLTALAQTDSFHVALLHGVTGSGKTEIYLRLSAAVRAAGRGVLMLVPEIGLTPAMASLFRQAFGDRVAIQHSGLSDGERHDQWQRIRRGDIDVVVGTRSAVFAPLDRVGLIVVDEEHDPAYKSDRTPRLQARDVPLPELQLSSVLDRHDALVVGQVAGQDVEQRRLAAAGASADDDVRSCHDARLQEPECALAAAAQADEVAHVERATDELADVQQRAVDGDGADGRMDARPVGEPRVGERRRRVDPPADRFDDVTDDRHEVVLRLEAERREENLAVDLDVDFARAHDHDLGHPRVGEQLADRAETGVVVRGQRDELVHCVNLTVDGHARRDGSAVMARFSLPRTVAVQAMRPPAMVARTRLVPLSLMSAEGM